MNEKTDLQRIAMNKKNLYSTPYFSVRLLSAPAHALSISWMGELSCSTHFNSFYSFSFFSTHSASLFTQLVLQRPLAETHSNYVRQCRQIVFARIPHSHNHHYFRATPTTPCTETIKMHASFSTVRTIVANLYRQRVYLF